MARPLMLLSIFLVYALGGLVALANGSVFNSASFIWGWLALLPLSMSVHYINEYADYETDALTRRTAFSGGSGVLPTGKITRSTALRAAWIAAGTGALIALAGVITGAIPAAAALLLLIGTVGGWMYSVEPLKLAWRGWGEVDNALLGGMILPLYGYAAQTRDITAQAVLIFTPFTLFVFTNLLAVTWADRHADGQVGKRTLAVLLNPAHLRILYWTMLIASAAVFIGLIEIALPSDSVWTLLVSLPLMIWGALAYTRIDSPHPSVLLMVVFLIAQLVYWQTMTVAPPG
jgi:1,4-dihydroxy-2-naphthoate octaprenyltransferase